MESKEWNLLQNSLIAIGERICETNQLTHNLERSVNALVGQIELLRDERKQQPAVKPTSTVRIKKKPITWVTCQDFAVKYPVMAVSTIGNYLKKAKAKENGWAHIYDGQLSFCPFRLVRYLYDPSSRCTTLCKRLRMSAMHHAPIRKLLTAAGVLEEEGKNE